VHFSELSDRLLQIATWGVQEADLANGFPSCSKSISRSTAKVKLVLGGAEMLVMTVVRSK
jgi:hypothetical protein